MYYQGNRMLNTAKITTTPAANSSLEAFHGLECGVALVDFNGVVQFWNHWLERVTGIRSESGFTAVSARTLGLTVPVSK